MSPRIPQTLSPQRILQISLTHSLAHSLTHSLTHTDFFDAPADPVVIFLPEEQGVAEFNHTITTLLICRPSDALVREFLSTTAEVSGDEMYFTCAIWREC